MLLEFGATVRVRNCDETDLAIATERGFKVADGGPDKITEVMSEVRKSAASERNGFYVDFDVFYDFLNKLDYSDKQNAPILDPAVNFAFR